jgi:hypothetical protein
LKTAGAEAEVALAMEAETAGEVEPDNRALTGQRTEGDYTGYLLRRLAETG